MFNGQGINTKDVDNQKDIIGGLWVMPISGMRLGAFGWTGSYARKDNNGIKVYLNVAMPLVVSMLQMTGLSVLNTYTLQDMALKLFIMIKQI